MITYVPTQEMVADIFTKGLDRVKHNYFIRLLGLFSESSIEVTSGRESVELGKANLTLIHFSHSKDTKSKSNICSIQHNNETKSSRKAESIILTKERNNIRKRKCYEQMAFENEEKLQKIERRKTKTNKRHCTQKAIWVMECYERRIGGHTHQWIGHLYK